MQLGFEYEASDWYAPLRQILSLGAQDEGVAHQGELAAARRRHLGQFFTPDAVARYMWGFVERFNPKRKVYVLDNSIGSGRLLQYADPERHTLAGIDVHEPVVAACQSAFEDAGFKLNIRRAGMEDIRPSNFDVAVINPPFSLHLESPHLSAFACTTAGRYGPNTSTLSHDYALAQALKAAQVVVALLPATMAEAIAGAVFGKPAHYYEAARRLAGYFELPDDAFSTEGANVRTAVLVFDRYRTKPGDFQRAAADLNAPSPALNLHWEDRFFDRPRLNLQTLDDSVPAITRPVTGDQRVRVAHDGRRIRLGFSCGFVEAMVLNAIYDHRIFSRDGHRLPQGFRYAGQGKLDLEVYLVQEDPVAAFGNLLACIRDAGGEPVVADGFREHLRARARRSQRQGTPLRHVVYTTGAGSARSVTGTAKATHKVDDRRWASPLIKAGDTVAFEREEDGQYQYSLHGVSYTLAVDELIARFAVENVSEGWEVVHEGLAHRFPEHAAALRHRVEALGIPAWLDWEFQVDDLVETLMKPTGTVIAWEQGAASHASRSP